jgi:methionine salvage enolase-phosphatase E1
MVDYSQKHYQDLLDHNSRLNDVKKEVEEIGKLRGLNKDQQKRMINSRMDYD